jgi:hypothetical protein
MTATNGERNQLLSAVGDAAHGATRQIHVGELSATAGALVVRDRFTFCAADIRCHAAGVRLFVIIVVAVVNAAASLELKHMLVRSSRCCDRTRYFEAD